MAQERERASQVSPSPPPGKRLTAAAGILVPCGVCHGKRFVAIWYDNANQVWSIMESNFIQISFLMMIIIPERLQ